MLPSDAEAVNFTGYWRQVKNEGFDQYMKVLGLPWVIRKLAKRFASGSTDIIWQRGRQMRVTTVNTKGAWTRMYSEGKQVYQKNAAGEPVRIKTWWEGKVHKCQATGSSFGVLESWRYMEDRLMVVKSRVVSPDGRVGEMFWFFEGLPNPHQLQKGSHQPSAVLTNVWKDQSLVEKATRKDNLHLQVLLHDLSRWETPADNYFHMFGTASEKTRTRGSRPVSPSSSQRSRPRPLPLVGNNTVPVATLSASSSQIELTHTPSSLAAASAAAADAGAVAQLLVLDSAAGPVAGPLQGPGAALPPRHRRVLSDPGSTLSVDTPSCSDFSGVEPGAAAASAAAAGSEAGGLEAASPLTAEGPSSLEGPAVGPGEALQPDGNSVQAIQGGLQAAGTPTTAAPLSQPQGSEGLDSAGIGSPGSGKSADAVSGRTAMSGTIRATPRGTPMPSMDQADLEKLLAWKIHEFKDVRGIASVVPVKNPGEPELLEMSPEQAEQTHAKLQELEGLSRLYRQSQARSTQGEP